MITVLSGPDSYRRKRRAREIVAAFTETYPQAPVLRLDGNDPAASERFTEFVRSSSLFESRKLAVVEPLFANGTKAVVEILKRTADDAHSAVIVSTDATPVSPFTFLKKGGNGIVAESFPRLTGENLAAWLAEEARIYRLVFTPSAMRLLEEAYGADTWSMATELQKISSWSKRTISERDLAAFGVETAPDFIQGIRGLTAASVAERLASLAQLLASGEPALKVFSMLPYWWPARLEMLAAYDRGVKSGKLDYEEALTDILIR